jgi:hypothetical protein
MKRTSRAKVVTCLAGYLALTLLVIVSTCLARFARLLRGALVVETRSASTAAVIASAGLRIFSRAVFVLPRIAGDTRTSTARTATRVMKTGSAVVIAQFA